MSISNLSWYILLNSTRWVHSSQAWLLQHCKIAMKVSRLLSHCRAGEENLQTRPHFEYHCSNSQLSYQSILDALYSIFFEPYQHIRITSVTSAKSWSMLTWSKYLWTKLCKRYGQLTLSSIKIVKICWCPDQMKDVWCTLNIRIEKILYQINMLDDRFYIDLLQEGDHS